MEGELVRLREKLDRQMREMAETAAALARVERRVCRIIHRLSKRRTRWAGRSAAKFKSGRGGSWWRRARTRQRVLVVSGVVLWKVRRGRSSPWTGRWSCSKLGLTALAVGELFFPQREALGLTARQLTPGLLARVVHAAAETRSFERAAIALDKIAGNRVSAKTIERVAGDVGGELAVDEAVERIDADVRLLHPKPVEHALGDHRGAAEVAANLDDRGRHVLGKDQVVQEQIEPLRRQREWRIAVEQRRKGAARHALQSVSECHGHRRHLARKIQSEIFAAIS